MKLRIKRGQYKSWVIQRVPVSKTGEESWVDYKYPGNLKALANGLLDEAVGSRESVFTQEEAQLLVDTIQKATETLIDALEGRLDDDSPLVLEI